VDYEIFKIKSYELWDLYLHKEQFPYIGRCYASAKSGAKNVVEMNTDEARELFGVIVPSWFKALRALYQPDWPNVAILGNDWQHLHAHLIPRYWNPKLVHGVNFTDPQPTKNYAPYPKMDLSTEVLMKIRDNIGENL